jgi:hypothetical protein
MATRSTSSQPSSRDRIVSEVGVIIRLRMHLSLPLRLAKIMQWSEPCQFLRLLQRISTFDLLIPNQEQVKIYVLIRRRRLDWLADSCSIAGGFCPFAVANLLRSELASANAATPARRCSLRNFRRLLPIRTLGSY